MASKIKVDTLETADGTGNITLNNPLAGNVGIGVTPSALLHVKENHSADDGLAPIIKIQSTNNNSIGDGSAIAFHGDYSGVEWGFGKIGGANSGANYGGSLEFHTNTGNGSSASVSYTKQLTITYDGRGLSQFTAKAWINFNGTGTVAIRDSHNVSSITDNGTGDYSVNFTNNMDNANYSTGGSNNDWNVSQTSDDYSTSTYKVRTANIASYGKNDVNRITSMVFGD